MAESRFGFILAVTVTGLAPRAFSRARFSGVWGDVEWADPLCVFSNLRSFCGQIEGTSALSAVKLAIKRTSRASDAPWAVAAVHRGRDIKNARNSEQLP